MQHTPTTDDNENLNLQVDILKSNANLHVQKIGGKEISVVGIENAEQYEFVVEIQLRHIDQCDKLDDKIQLTYKLFDEQKLELTKSTEDGHFHINQTIPIQFKSSLSDLIIYFRNIFSLPIVLAAHNDEIRGKLGLFLVKEKKYYRTNEFISNVYLVYTIKILLSIHRKCQFPKKSISIISLRIISGSTHLNFGDSLSTLPASVQSFQEIFSATDLTYQFESFSSIKSATGGDGSDETEPNVHYTFSLKLIPYNRDKAASPTSLLLPYTTLQSASFNKITSASVSPRGHEEQMNEKEINNVEITTEKASGEVPSAIPKTFAYTLSLLDCSFNKRPFPGIWQLSLQHPGADSTVVVRNLEISDIVIDQISFEDMHLRLCFTSHSDQLFDLIKSKPCLLTLKGPRGVHASAELDNHNILTQEKTKGIVLLENEQNEQVAMAHISVETEELGLNFNTDAALKARQLQKQQLPSHGYIDEDLAYKMIEELEEWKFSQQKVFLVELKRREIEHLTQLSNEWQRKRREQELKLQKKMEHCDRLTQTLEEAHNMFKERNRSDIEYEHTLLKTKSDLERCYAKKIDSLNGTILQMEKENFIRQKNDELILKEVEAERDQLKMECKKLKAKVKTLERDVRIGNNTDENTQEQINELKDYVVSLR